MIRHIPNFLTCCNLICGCLGVVFALEGRTFPAAYFVWIACVFDFLDGFAARMLKVSSPIGKELDSLADMVSFGLLPSIVMYTMFEAVQGREYVPYIAFSIAVFSALRLAIFNVDTRQSDSFRGLPTPANALLITALPLLTGEITNYFKSYLFLTIITIISSYLMVSDIELFALKFKNFSWQDNKIRFTFLLLSVLLLATLQLAAIPLIILFYIALSLGVRAVSK
ncbi:MAG TPA: CDP-diacylglycerol--serine O-phosphatidyltransferase [Cyclobacteriaceae bacterium]|nr:CDP-diacylglycerol--serine O-phosphatidyltransferase [Cyclobacteriaceae bacterium]